MAGAEILVVLPTLGDRIDTLTETLKTIQSQRQDVDLSLVVVTPVRARVARALALEYGATLVDDPGTGISEAINCGSNYQTDCKTFCDPFGRTIYHLSISKANHFGPISKTNSDSVCESKC